MNALMGIAIMYTATSYAMNNNNMHDFEYLRILVSAAKGLKAEECIQKHDLNRLIIAICCGNQEQAARIKIEQPRLMDQKVHGLYPVHWAVIGKQDGIREWLQKCNPRNSLIQTDSGFTAFDLQVKFDAWYQDQTKERELLAGSK
jgi:hypothetical protein